MSLANSLLEKHAEEFAKLFKLYTDYNATHNLSSIKEESEVYQKHFLDSLIVLDHVKLSDGKRLLDVGTGGGFPALPLAIVLPELKITAIDSTQKKIDFLNLVKIELDLKNLEPICCRAEELAYESQHRERYDFVLSRAVAELRILLELVIPFIKVGAKFIAYKKADNQVEMDTARNSLKELSSKIIQSIVYAPDRQFLIIEKERVTKTKYPREFKQIKKKPL